MLVFSNCKINLGLHILNKRPDAYHNLETVFYPLNLCDVLEVIKGNDTPYSKIKIITEGISIGEKTEKNLIAKAYHLLDSVYGLEPVTFCLLKNIPLGAGLGGGSGNAAFTLKLLNQLFDLKISDEQLINYAGQLGSDCAFFIKNKPCFASGRGEILHEINLDLSMYSIVIVKPPVHVSTKEAFCNLKSSEIINLNHPLRDIINLPIAHWKDHLFNDFESSVFSTYPILAEIKDTLYREGALYAAMSGSGSAIFGIFKSKPRLNNSFPGFFYFET
ncbi:MAG: 4-(cytidine 5'-diphospho)-2-C-methyl-D-erythritol kinase [Bacteroidota bacterium]|nr:4-(cytidine 5'-diphospho)-2-C-methyl-D-erythritol kinase [Bacteroidota bacterium]